MKFAPDYVTCVLNDNFEDAKAQFLSPLMAIHYAHLVMLAEQRHRRRQTPRTPSAGARRDRSRRGSRGAVRRHLRGPVLLRRSADRRRVRRGRGRPAAHRALAQRHRHDDVPDAAAGDGAGAGRRDAGAAPTCCSTLAARHPGDVFPAHTHTQPAQPIDDRALPDGGRRTARARHRPAAGGLCEHQPEPARRVRDHRHRVSDRSRPDDGAARIRRRDRQHLRQHRHRRLSARERVGGGGAADRAGPGGAGSAALVHERVRLPAAVGRIRAVQQHHAAEAQSGRARARPRDRQQGGRAGERPSCSLSTTRRSATSSTPRTICSRWSSRCSATPSGRSVWSPRR